MKICSIHRSGWKPNLPRGDQRFSSRLGFQPDLCGLGRPAPTILLLGLLSAFTTTLPASPNPTAFLEKYCIDCHDEELAKGDVRLDNFANLDWAAPSTTHLYERLHRVLSKDNMPPPEEKARPSQEERKTVLAYLHNQLLENSPPSGTVLRRLNRREYENTIESLFGFPFQVPAGFPPDQTSHGFDNIGDKLVLSPPLMESFFEAATAVADQLFPPPPPKLAPTTIRRGPDQMAISYSSSLVIDGSMRLAQKTPTIIRSCTWPTSFEAKASAKYKITVKLSAIGVHPDGTMQFHIYANDIAGDKGNADDPRKLRRLGAFEVTSAEPKEFTCEGELYQGETPIFYYANAPLDSQDPKGFAAYLDTQFKTNPRLLAGWMAVTHNRGLRGGVGWDRVKAKMALPDLDLSKADPNHPTAKKVITNMVKQARQYVESISYQVFEEGPAIGVHEAVMEGPLERVDGDAERKTQQLQQQFLGKATNLKGQPQVEAVLQSFLPQAFRKPVGQGKVAGYTRMVMAHLKQGHTLEEGLHLAIRSALVSPDFLYRDGGQGEMDQHGLASRLAYFLTGSPPDPTLRAQADSGNLANPAVLHAQARRLLKSKGRSHFVTHFTGQWLHLDHLPDIMPDARLIDFKPSDHIAMRKETQSLFSEILTKNLPIQTFITPGFTYLNRDLATRIYGRKDVKSKSFTRVKVPPGSPYGGLLGQASVMMATANGVDTQPVMRGVWVLENILGTPTPPPPDDVPAITPDTRGTKTVRDLMAAHTSEPTCARCHKEIDPLGFVLENFDPIGRWRTHYPVYDDKNQRQDGPPVTATSTLPDGTPLKDVQGLKQYVVENPGLFGQCLSEKLMAYATGRLPNYNDRHEIRSIVAKHLQSGGGFQDLLLALIQSDCFGKR